MEASTAEEEPKGEESATEEVAEEQVPQEAAADEQSAEEPAAEEQPATPEEEYAASQEEPTQAEEEPATAAPARSKSRHRKRGAAQFPMQGFTEGVVAVPVPVLFVAVVFLVVVGVFLLHFIFTVDRNWQYQQPAAEALVSHTPVPPALAGFDKSFLLRVKTVVSKQRCQVERSMDAAHVDVERSMDAAHVDGPPLKKMDDSSDDCSSIPRFEEKEPESEADEGEAGQKELEAQWALQIAYQEALARCSEDAATSHEALASGGKPWYLRK